MTEEFDNPEEKTDDLEFSIEDRMEFLNAFHDETCEPAEDEMCESSEPAQIFFDAEGFNAFIESSFEEAKTRLKPGKSWEAVCDPEKGKLKVTRRNRNA